MNASGEGSGTRNGKRHARGHPAMARPACETPGGIRGRPGSWSRLMSPGATSTLTPPGRTGNSPCLKRRVRQTAEPGHRSTGSMGKGQAARGPQSDNCAAVRHAGNQRVSGMVGGRRSAVGGRNGALATTFFRCGRSLRWLGDGDPGFDAGWHRRRTWEQFVPEGPEMGRRPQARERMPRRSLVGGRTAGPRRIVQVGRRTPGGISPWRVGWRPPERGLRAGVTRFRELCGYSMSRGSTTIWAAEGSDVVGSGGR